jgi:NAD(P)-dependent dehydrogenase (short-subunit alcohol dehydrogenase family)
LTVNSVLPGPTLTPAPEGSMDQVVGEDAADLEESSRLMIERLRPTSLLGRLADPEEVANLIVYLASPQASATTGASMRVDAGVVRTVA